MTTAHTKKNVKRKKVANQIIKRRMLYAAGLGLIPIPIVDAAGVLGIQVVMIKDMASLYRVPFKEHVFKSLIGSMLGSVGTLGAVKAIPGLGTILGGATVSMSAAASTYAVGNVFMQHFAQGGTLLDFDPVKSRIYFQDFYEEGARKAQVMSVERLKKSSKKIGLAINPTKNANGSDTGSATQNKVSGKREDPALAKSKRIKELKAKRRKLVKAKKRKSYIRKTIGKVFSVSLLCLLTWQFYFKNLFDNSSMSTEIDLYMKEAKAKKFQLPATGDLDSLSNLHITKFAPNSTEYVIARYIESPDATYPKRYALSAVRFTGSSESLSSGATEQLSNIALLMKKYPDLLVNLYGHTTNLGPKFNRQRVGRERSRVLKEIFEDEGIPTYRLTGNYIEKTAGTHDEYWGAEIVIDISTEESVVEIAPLTLPTAKDVMPGFVNVLVETISSDAEEEKTEAPKDKIVTSNSANEIDAPVSIAQQDNSNISLTKDTSIAEQEEVASNDTTADQVDTSLVNTPDTTIIEEAPVEPEPKETELAKEEETDPKAEINPVKSNNTEDIVAQYLEKPNAVYPKVFSLNNVQFEGESSELDGANKQILHIAELMKQYPKMKIEVYGHTAGAESEEQAVQLKWQEIGMQRAKAIEAVLKNNGISKRRMSSKARRQRRAITEKYWGAEIIIKNK